MLALCLAGAVLAGGCASVEDFRVMPPSERADYVCDRHRDVVRVASLVSAVEVDISDTEQAISLGYRLHRSCRYIPATRTTEERCTTEKAEKEDEEDVKVCKETVKVEREEVCQDVPVVVDGASERQKLKDYRAELRQLEIQLGKEFDACHNTVRGMSAERAFDYYKQTRSGYILQ